MLVKTLNKGDNTLQDFGQDFFAGIDVADKKVLGVNTIRLFGAVVGQSSFPCDLTNIGLNTYAGFPTSPVTLQVFSNNSGDSISGIGARRVMLFGVDSNFEEQIEVVNMNGTTPVLTTKTWLRCSKAVVIEAGSNQGAVGTITILGASITFGRILPQINQTLNLVYSVPKNKTAFISSLWFSLNRTSGGAVTATDRDVDIQFHVRDTIRNVVYRTMIINITQMQNFVKECLNFPLIIGSKCDFWVTCSNGNGTPIDISGFVGIYVKDYDVS